jgi:hypothetical protein
VIPRSRTFFFDLAATRGPRVFVFRLRREDEPLPQDPAGYRLGRVNRQTEEPDAQWKAAAFVRWHEPDDARVSSPESGPYAAHPKKDFP